MRPTPNDVHQPGLMSTRRRGNHARSLCMLCKETPPDVEVLWNGGQNRSWFCAKCFPGWYAEKSADEVMSVTRLKEGKAGKRYRVRSSLKGLGKAYLEKQNDYTTAMIALFVPPDVAQKVAVKDGLAPEELHITLAFLGEANTIPDLEALKVFVQNVAANGPKLTGKINGVGKFGNTNSDGLQPFYASPDIPDLPAFRQKIIEGLETYLGIPTSKEHGFIPHITLKYVKPGSALPAVNLTEYPLTFDRLTLSLGNVRFDYLLGVPMTTETLLKVNGSTVTLGDLAKAWLSKETKFTSAPWSTPESKLDTGDFIKVCLVNLNEPGGEPVKAKAYFPIRSTPGGPVNLNALRNAAARLPQANIPQEARQEAARKIVRLMREAGIEPGEATLGLAGENVEKAEAITLTCEIVKADKKRQTITSVVLQPERTDAQKDIISAEEILDAIHSYMMQSRNMDYLHKEILPQTKAVPVEVYAAPMDFELDGHPVRKGAWVQTTKILDPELWQEIESGKIRAYSIKGVGKRTKVG